jgi:hypothetical protein
MPDFTHVNWLAVVIAAVVNIAIGYVWYYPAVLGKRWEAAAGRSMAQPTPMMYGLLLVASLLFAYVLGLLFGGIGLVNGAVWGALIWVGFLAASTVGTVIWEGRNWTYWGINNGYWLVTLIVMGAIIGYFPATM